MSIIPPTRPRIARAEAVRIANEALIKFGAPRPDLTTVEEILNDYPLMMLELRGYRKNSMGKPGVNDTGMYDDAICFIARTGFSAFNCTSDPESSKHPEGAAKMEPGVSMAFCLDVHARGRASAHIAICQRLAAIKFRRKDGVLRSGMIGRNIHRGGRFSTFSEACCTLPPDEWTDAIDFAISAVGFVPKHGKKSKFPINLPDGTVIPHVLVEL